MVLKTPRRLQGSRVQGLTEILWRTLLVDTMDGKSQSWQLIRVQLRQSDRDK
jgi:hypothetical protein